MKRYLFLLLLILLIFNRVDFIKYALNDEEEKTMATRKITLGAGCFWCVETSFRRLRGVSSAISGYSGGHTPNPTYEQVNKLLFTSKSSCETGSFVYFIPLKN